MTAPPPDTDARALYQVPPKGFVAARNRRVKELRAEGRRDDATALATLRRPRLAEHALNLVAAAEPSLIERFAGAVEAASDAQRAAIERGEGAALRTATEELRAASGAIVTAAVRALDAEGESGAAQRMEIGAILRDSVGADAVALLRAGLVGSVAPEDAETLVGDVRARPEATGRAATKKTTKTTKATRPSTMAPPERGDDADRPVARTAAQRREDARRAKEQAAARRALERDLHAAQAAQRAAERDVERAERALAAAEAALDEARERADAARSEVADVEERVQALE